MRPRLKRALRRIDRDARTIQFGVHPAQAVVLGDVEPAVRRLIDSLDGTRTLEQAIAESELTERSAREVIGMLTRHGVLEDASASPEPLARLTVAERDRLRPDLDRLSLTCDDGGMGALRARRAAHVRLHGAGRVGAQVAVLLAAAGVGNLCVVDPGTARHEGVVPGGLGWDDVGRAREDGAVAAARRIAPSVNAWPGRTASRLSDRASRPDLVVLAPVGPLDPALIRELGEEGIPHLLVTAYEGRGSVGPFVLPGVTPCLVCLELTRRDRDPGWPMVGARLGGYPGGEIACDTALATLVAAEAVIQVLAYLDRSSVMKGTLDVLPDGHWRHRTWDVHPQCACGRTVTASLTMVE